MRIFILLNHACFNTLDAKNEYSHSEHPAGFLAGEGFLAVSCQAGAAAGFCLEDGFLAGFGLTGLVLEICWSPDGVTDGAAAAIALATALGSLREVSTTVSS